MGDAAARPRVRAKVERSFIADDLDD
jgi:hypothetical protein